MLHYDLISLAGKALALPDEGCPAVHPFLPLFNNVFFPRMIIILLTSQKQK